MKAFFIAQDVGLKVTLIRLLVVDVVVEDLIDIYDLRLDILCRIHQILPQLLYLLESSSRPFKDGLGDEHVCITHELFILAYLRV